MVALRPPTGVQTNQHTEKGCVDDDAAKLKGNDDDDDDNSSHSVAKKERSCFHTAMEDRVLTSR